MNKIQLIYFEKDINEIASEFFELTRPHKHFAFYGSMGAGKTTFITAICRQLEIDDMVSSPTFSIINEYSTKAGVPVFHFDFYRIKSQEELLDIGFDEYCTDEAYCFIEWPEKGEDIMPDDFIKVEIKEVENGKRAVSIQNQ